MYSCCKCIKKVFCSKSMLITFVICVGVFALGNNFHLVLVAGNSMNPSYQNGNLLVTSTDIGSIKIDDIVVFTVDGKKVKSGIAGNKNERSHPMIKRVVGIPGDNILILDGILYRNGKPIDSSFSKINTAGIAKDIVKLKEGEYFVLGDNRNNSYDSRYFGAINKSEITNIVNYQIHCKVPLF